MDHGDKREGRNAVERFVGRARRGAPSRADLDQDLRMDLGDAIGEIVGVRDDGISGLRLPEVVELGRVARREAAASVADRLLRAARICTAVADSLCAGRSAELQAEMGDAFGADE